MALTDIKPPLSLLELATVFRQTVDDLPGDIVADTPTWEVDDSGLLWANSEICRYADEARNEYVLRRGGILDTNQTIGLAITHITVSSGSQQQPYSDKILKWDRAKFVETVSGDETVLQRRTVDWMDLHYKNWDLESNASTPGIPRIVVEYGEERVVRLYPVPNVAGVLHLTVWRLPVNRLTWAGRHAVIAEIQTDHHLDLLDWMLFRAYQKRDAETENKDLALEHEALFTARIGERPSASLQQVRRMEHRVNRRVRAHFF